MSSVEEAALERAIAERSAEVRRIALESRPLRWLALSPEWTRELAKECEFPVDDGGLDELLEWAEGLSLCKVSRERTIADLERVRFWVPKSERASLFEEWRSSGADLGADLAEISDRIVGAPEDVRRKSATGVLRWAELSKAELSAKVANGEGLRQRVATAIDQGDPAVAAEWVRAGESLGLLLGGEMELAATRARRRLERHYREAQDARYLREFVNRDEQAEAITDLLGPSRQWALHFFGQSGVGKTMLMRHLTNRVPISSAEADGSPGSCPAARIDFDHVDPSFPLERPAGLLVELADGLASHATNPAQEASFIAFEQTVTAYEVARTQEIEPDPIAALRSPRFGRVIDAFADFTKSLPSPVLLILDTCEELAKLHPAGEDVPSVEAMFEIVELVRAADDNVLVVFAGRRWLTPKAANMDRSEDATPPAVMSMKARPYLNMQPALGFTRAEAEKYLRDARELSLEQAMVEAVLENTRDRGKPASLKDGDGEPEGERYKPSTVELYSRWIESEPNLSPADLASGNHDAYVEVRIFKRIESVEVKAAIPAAMLLERFDWSMIEPALSDIGAPAKALTGLIEQEWTHLEGGPEPEQMVISVDQGLLPPLREFFEHDQGRRNEVEAARRGLVPHLRRLFDQPTKTVAPYKINAAIRVLDPDEAGRCFEHLAKRVAVEQAWSWGESVCSLLLAPERDPELPGPLFASVCALYVSVLAQRGATADLTALRREIIKRAPEHFDLQTRWTLEARAQLGMVASGAERDPKAVLEALTRARIFLKMLGPALAPALLAATEALIDAHEAEGLAIPADNLSQHLTELHRSFEGNALVQAYLVVLEGRLRIALGERSRALAAFKRADHIQLGGEVQPGFVDWVAPASLHHRILYEVLRHRVSLGAERPKFLDRCDAMAQAGSGVDAGQLLSLVLQTRRARGELNERDLASALRFEESLEAYELTSFAHRCVPPLFASIAECLLDLGQPQEGLDLLLERERRATARRTAGDTDRAAALATLRILRRYRLREQYGLISNLSSSPDPEVRAEAMAAGALIAGLRPPRGPASAEDHLAWRARAMLDPREEEAVLAAIAGKQDPANGRERLSMALDRLEAEMVRRRWALRGNSGEKRARREVERLARSIEEASSSEPLGEECLRLNLRRAALLGRLEELGMPTRSRRSLVARLALEEGELMALRVPDRAAMLLFLAERMMGGEDRRGAFTAALRRAIANIHAGDPEVAAQASVEVFARYDELREVEPGLPSLANLRDRSLALDDLEGNPWHQWVWRLEVYRRWRDDRPARERGGPPSFEPETELNPALGAGGIEVRAAVRRGGPATWTAVGGIVVLLIGLVVGLQRESVGTGIAAAAGFLGVVVGSALVGGIVSVLAFTIWQRIFGWGMRADGYDLSLVLARRFPDSPLAVEARLKPWARKRASHAFLRVIRRLPPRSRWVIAIPLDEDLFQRPLPHSLQMAVARRARRGQPVVIRLLVAGNLAGVAWERWLLAERGFREALSPDLLPSVWRIRTRDLHLLPEGEWPAGVGLRAAPRWRPFIETSATLGIEWREPRYDGPGRVAIALGFPAFTGAGWRLRIDEDLTLGRFEVEGEAATQELLSPDRLAAEAPIAIIVGRPGGDLASERWSADGLRAFANETSLAGARAVLVVPSLPADRATDAIRIITEAINAWSSPPERDQLRGLASQLRRAAFEGAGGLGEEERRARYEQALDICLFMPS